MFASESVCCCCLLQGKFSLDVHLPELAVGAHEEVWLEGEGAGANLAFTAFPKPN